MSARRWSLRNRSAFWFTISAALFLGIAALVTDVAYRTLIAGELEEEAAEEIEEFRLRLLAGPSDAEWYARLLEPAGREDAETPAAWWVRDATGEHGPFGSRELARQRPPVLEQSGVTVRFAGALLHRREALDAGREVELVLDGSQWTSRLRAFEAGLFAVFVLGTLLSLVFGRLYSNRVARALEDTAQAIVASRTRAEAGSVGIADAPEEIRAVLEAAESILRATRADSRRARLLTAGMAHDLRAPIQNLITATEVTLLKPREAQRYREALENRLEELRELGSTIDNLVSYCSPAISLEEHVAFDLREALSHALPREESAARRRGVLLDAEFRGELVLVGDAEALALVARNLIRNAVQWSPPGGEVHLLAESCDQGVRIAVEDQGPGVTPELEAALTSAELGVQRVPGRRAGYGLGLALAREVAVRHGGRLYAEAAALGGARLVLEIPRPA